MRHFILTLAILALAAAPVAAVRYPVTSVAFAPGGQLVTASLDGLVRFWSVPSGSARGSLPFQGNLQMMAVNARRSMLALAETSGALELVDLKTRKKISSLPGAPGDASCLVFSPDGQTLAVAVSQDIALIDLRTDRVIRHQRGIALAFSPDGKRTAIGTLEGRVILCDAAGRPIAAWQAARGFVASCVAFSPDGRTLAVGTGDRHVLLYDLDRRRLRHTLTGHQGALTGLAWSPDGRTLASSGMEVGIRLWDPATGRLRATLRGHPAAVLSIAFSADGRHLASAGLVGVACLWSRSGKLLKKIEVMR